MLSSLRAVVLGLGMGILADRNAIFFAQTLSLNIPSTESQFKYQPNALESKCEQRSADFSGRLLKKMAEGSISQHLSITVVLRLIHAPG